MQIGNLPNHRGEGLKGEGMSLGMMEPAHRESHGRVGSDAERLSHLSGMPVMCCPHGINRLQVHACRDLPDLRPRHAGRHEIPGIGRKEKVHPRVEPMVAFGRPGEARINYLEEGGRNRMRERLAKEPLDRDTINEPMERMRVNDIWPESYEELPDVPSGRRVRFKQPARV